MTLRKAQEILIEAAVRDVKGAGLGYRSNTDEFRAKTREAVIKVWEHLNKRKITTNEKFNLGL